MFQKDKPYRNQKLRDVARHVPYCMGCKKPNDGTIVGCHSNRQHDGKGTGQKAHDLLAYCCSECHAYIDGNGDKRERHCFFLQAVYNSIVWLLKEGYLEVK